ncbi:MAG TPA: DUF2007 domain-containing protein [Bacteroidales bacterium]|nr:DUF2007 domain-containing protein [Bacteroidales bacterium]HPS63899.1 DUF2007 domain-containing protein [Bacteroidales bacterium]
MNKRILPLNSEIEAIRIREILEVNEIPHIINSYHDTAYNGVFQAQYGWGVLVADEADEERILAVLQEFQASEPDLSDSAETEG